MLMLMSVVDVVVEVDVDVLKICTMYVLCIYGSFFPSSVFIVHFIKIMSQMIIQCMTSDNDDGDDEIKHLISSSYSRLKCSW